MKAIRRFTVRTVLPEQLQPLHELALNLRWSWHPETRELFRSVDPEVWSAVGEDPVRLLGEVPAARWPRSRPTGASYAGWATSPTTCATTSRPALVPERAVARRRLGPAARRDRVLLARVRHRRRAAAVLRRARHPGRRPPEGRQRPRRATGRRRPVLPARLLPAVALPGRLAAGALPAARPGRAGRLPAPRAGRHPLPDRPRAAGRPHAGRADLEGPGRPRPLLLLDSDIEPNTAAERE